MATSTVLMWHRSGGLLGFLTSFMHFRAASSARSLPCNSCQGVCIQCHAKHWSLRSVSTCHVTSGWPGHVAVTVTCHKRLAHWGCALCSNILSRVCNWQECHKYKSMLYVVPACHELMRVCQSVAPLFLKSCRSRASHCCQRVTVCHGVHVGQSLP
jgi:hypothetical protein